MEENTERDQRYEEYMHPLNLAKVARLALMNRYAYRNLVGRRRADVTAAPANASYG